MPSTAVSPPRRRIGEPSKGIGPSPPAASVPRHQPQDQEIGAPLSRKVGDRRSAPPHRISVPRFISRPGMPGGRAAGDQRAGDHPAGGVGAERAAQRRWCRAACGRRPAHRRAVDADRAAAHAGHLAGQWDRRDDRLHRPRSTGIAAAHRRAGKAAGRAASRSAVPPLITRPSLPARIALDVDRTASRPSPIRSKRSEPPSKRIVAGSSPEHVEDIADGDRLSGRADRQRRDLVLAKARKPRRERGPRGRAAGRAPPSCGR